MDLLVVLLVLLMLGGGYIGRRSLGRSGLGIILFALVLALYLLGYL